MVFDTSVGAAAAAAVAAAVVDATDAVADYAIQPVMALMKPVNHHQSIHLILEHRIIGRDKKKK